MTFAAMPRSTSDLSAMTRAFWPPIRFISDTISLRHPGPKYDTSLRINRCVIVFLDYGQ